MLASAAEKGKRAWFVVHRVELLRQSVNAFIESADIHTGVIAAGFPSSPLAPVQVCSVQTLARRVGSVHAPDLIVWDECHHLASNTWATLAAAVPHAKQIGLSATPTRLDGRGLKPFFDALVCGPSTADLIAQGYLAPYRLFAPTTVALEDVHTVAGDYNKRELGDAMDGSTVTGDAVAHYLAHCAGGRALVFAWSIAASQRLASAFLAAGVAAAHVDGETPASERQDAMARFQRGDLRVLCNVELFGEGIDVPSVDAVFLLRPTQSLGLYLQQVGRGLRPAPGKAFVRIFDHAGNWERHGLPDDPRVWSLDGRPKKARESEPSGKRCPQCFAVSAAWCKACAACGVPFLVQAREVVEVAGALPEVDIEALRAKRAVARESYAACRTLADWQRLAKSLGYKSGWAWRMHVLSKQHRRAS